MSEKIEVILEDVKRHIDYLDTTNQWSIRDNEMRVMYFEIERLNDIINESRRILGEYKHFSTPTEEQNSENEDIVDKAYLTLHENLRK